MIYIGATCKCQPDFSIFILNDFNWLYFQMIEMHTFYWEILTKQSPYISRGYIVAA